MQSRYVTKYMKSFVTDFALFFDIIQTCIFKLRTECLKERKTNFSLTNWIKKFEPKRTHSLHNKFTFRYCKFFSRNFQYALTFILV